MRRLPAETSLLLVTCFAFADEAAHAKEAGYYDDLETVEVTGARDAANAEVGTFTSITPADFKTVAPSLLPDALVLVPSINLRTNSRGETLASIRGSGERQLALLWNGVPINVPWDNRFDLNLLPSAGISSIEVRAGATAQSFGANTAGGVIDVRTGSLDSSQLSFQAGSGDLQVLDGAFAYEKGTFKQSIAFSHFERDGLVSPSSSGQFSASISDLITNTDRNATNVSTRSEIALDKVRLGFSLLWSGTEFGVAPEQGPRIDPGDARFWRLPDTDHNLVALDAEIGEGQSIVTQITMWTQEFDQTIQSFNSTSYTELDETQVDENRTYGGRVSLSHKTASSSTLATVLGHWSQHQETRTEYGSTVAQQERFTHYQFSLAVDHSRQLNDATILAVGLGYDQLNPGETAGRGFGPKFDGVSGSINVSFEAPEGWNFRLGLARKVRLPTMRELFGEALGRFVLNPSLVPEKSWIFEASAQYAWAQGSVEFTPFLTETNDTLDQTRIDVSGDFLRQRINLRGSRHYGIETRADIELLPTLQLEGYVTWSRNRAKTDSVANATRRRYLSDRPNWLARVEARYQLGTRTTFGLNVVYRGAAKSEAGNGDFLSLSPATTVNLSARHSLFGAQNGSNVELFAQVDNLTDEFIEPQLGLPDAGRTLTLGVRALF
ncbi:MAG: TonB-dependent receptor [Kordiimonadaceae bacterium]|nr:TonB-dependent receptor [Kordiimonadaceae bacterium]MBO6570443.1 TonB-dependent receptor [Kordiimonadaceae bacterium]MBO6966438.1 TonB-dependent receptor [Kordiimonadaceae bacterium]